VFLNAGSRGIFDRCFSNTIAFSTGVFQTPLHLPTLTLHQRVGRIEHHDRCLLTLVLVYFAQLMGSVWTSSSPAINVCVYYCIGTREEPAGWLVQTNHQLFMCSCISILWCGTRVPRTARHACKDDPEACGRAKQGGPQAAKKARAARPREQVR
jgi:hypothetical protein